MTDNGNAGGFELEGTFYSWSVTDKVRDLRLIDMLTGMAVPEFFRAVEDEHERERGPVVSAMIATSIRAAKPDWSVERIFRMVDDVNLGEVKFIVGESDDEDPLPPSNGASTPTSVQGTTSTSATKSDPSQDSPTPETSDGESETPA